MADNAKISINIPRWAQVTASCVIVIIIFVHVIYPKLAIDSITISLLVLLIVVWFFPWVKAFKFPGGEIQMRDVEKAQESLAKVDLPRRPQPPTNLTITAIDGVELGKLSLRDQLLEGDPNLALASLRIEIERRLRELATKRGIFVQKIAGVTQVIQALRERGDLDPKLASSLLEIIALCNRAVHGAKVDTEVARSTVALGEELLSVLNNLIQ